MKLDHGYYWISYRSGGPRISRWDGTFWHGEYNDGFEGCFYQEHVKVLSRRQIKPTAAVLRKLNRLSK